MSAVVRAPDWISPEEYLEAERLSQVKHEYVEGVVYAMPDTTANHNRIAVNILSELLNRLDDTGCEPFGSDLRLRLADGSVYYYYPDVSVACDPADNDTHCRERPSVVFEIISPETERIDRAEKALTDHRAESVEAYVLVEQDRVAMTVLHRADDRWRREVLEGSNAVLKLPTIGIEIPFDRIYERTGLV